jgi:hypothetical protein
VRVEELGLGFATVGALAVPPAGAVAVEVGARAGGDGDVGSGDGDEGARPLFVAEMLFRPRRLPRIVGSCLRSEDRRGGREICGHYGTKRDTYMSARVETRKIESHARGDSNRRQNDSRAGRLGLASRRGAP